MSRPITPARPAIERSVHASTLASMVLALAARHDGDALRVPRDGMTARWSYDAFDRRVRDVAGALVELGVEPGDRVALLGATAPEWTIADCAVLAAGAVVVPVYHTNSPEECAYVLAHSGARAVLCEDAAQVAKIDAIRDQCPDLEHVLDLDLAAPTGPGAGPGGDLDHEVAARAAAVRPDDLATIVYTSGTTGPPKGCRLTHANLLAAVTGYEERLKLDRDAVVFLFLPLAHVLARVTQLTVLDVGGALAYWRGDAAVVLEDLAALAPTHVPAVPRVFEKIRGRALASTEGSAVKQRLMTWALSTGTAMRHAQRSGTASPWLRARHAVADRLVLSKVRALFGPNLQLALTGAAPIAADVLEFFDACGVLVVEGYGLTESCAAGTLNVPEAFRFGTVGRPLPHTEAAIAEDGEILLRGGLVFDGYHRDAEATAAMKDGEWLLTGDLGELDPDGFLRITGRKKDLIITSSGKNVAPANIEAALRESRWISQAVVAGDNRPYLVALLTLDPEEAPALAEQLGLGPDLGTMAQDPKVHEALAEDVDVANARFARIEQVKRFTVLDHDLSQSGGELTPTLKVKRGLVTDRYADEIAALYARE